MADYLEIQRIRSTLMQPGGAGPIQELQPVAAPAAAQQAEKPGEVSFADALKASIAEVNDLRIEASKATEALATGQSADIQGTILAVEKAEISFKLMMEVRNKIVSAYQEVMRTQV